MSDFKTAVFIVIVVFFCRLQWVWNTPSSLWPSCRKLLEDSRQGLRSCLKYAIACAHPAEASRLSSTCPWPGRTLPRWSVEIHCHTRLQAWQAMWWACSQRQEIKEGQIACQMLTTSSRWVSIESCRSELLLQYVHMWKPTPAVKGKLDLTSSTCFSSWSAPHAQCQHILEAFVAEQMTQASKLVQNGRKLCILLQLEELLKFVEIY